jgi:hypothetical protein
MTEEYNEPVELEGVTAEMPPPPTFPEYVAPPEPPFIQYRRTQIAEMREWYEHDTMEGVAVSAVDLMAGSPKLGDMIARNPANHADKWLVAEKYFIDNFEPL